MRTRKFASEIYSPLQLKETKTDLGLIVQFVPTFNKKNQTTTDRQVSRNHKKKLKLHVYEIQMNDKQDLIFNVETPEYY